MARLLVSVVFNARTTARIRRVAAKYGSTPEQLVTEAVREFLDAESSIERDRRSAQKTERASERATDASDTPVVDDATEFVMDMLTGQEV